MNKGFLEKIWNVSDWKKRKEKTSKFMNAGSNNWNERKEINGIEWIDKGE